MWRTLALLSLLLPTLAFADQCAWVTNAQASEAEGALKGKRVIEWCAPCGERRPPLTKAKKVNTVKVKPTSGGSFEVSVNGKAVDLAYLYVEDRPSHFRNVADLVGCPAEGVAKAVE